MDDSNVRGCWKAVCLNQNTAIDHLFHIISYGAKSAVGSFETCRPIVKMSSVEQGATRKMCSH